MPQPIDTIIEPKWTLIVEPTVAVRSDLAVAIHEGRLLDMGPATELNQRYRADARHERRDHLLMPGLVNAHCHAAMALMRGFADDLPLRTWLEERIWPAESRLITREFVADGTRLGVAEMLLGGITCFADMYYFPDVVADVALEASMRASVGMIALEFPTAWAENADEYISKGLSVHDRYGTEPLITTTFAPHAPYSVSDATLQKIRELADELDVPVHTHIHETADEVEQSLEESGLRPLGRLERLGLVTSALLGVHATQLNDDEIAMLGKAGASIAHCPTSNLKLASGACPVHRLLEAGANVALGTDGAASNNRLDLWSELRLAALLGKLVAADATAVPAAAAIRMATINGAKALGISDETGSLAVGKYADIVCVDLSTISQQPVLDPLSQLVYSVERDQVSDVWVAGEHLVANGELLRLDPTDISAAAHGWALQLSRL
jgi:5-methylthioadenosine/S-adenosylhomocysteine deaminase